MWVILKYDIISLAKYRSIKHIGNRIEFLGVPGIQDLIVEFQDDTEAQSKMEYLDRVWSGHKIGKQDSKIIQ